VDKITKFLEGIVIDAWLRQMLAE